MSDLTQPTAGMRLITEVGPLGSTAANMTLTIPSGYRAIHLMLIARGDTAATSTTVTIVINADSGANYDRQLLTATNATASASAAAGATSSVLGTITAASAPASLPGIIIADIPLYAVATLRKALLARSGLHTGDAVGGFVSTRTDVHWRSTAAVTGLVLTPGAGNFDVGSWCAAYGIT